MDTPNPARPQHHEDLLLQHLHRMLDNIDPAVIGPLRRTLEWVELPAGAALMRQGEAGDSMYLLVSGRLRALALDSDDPEGAARVRGEISRGQIVGEMSLYTDAPRSATVVAVRDSLLVRLSRQDFEHVLAASPQASIQFTRQIIQRLQGELRRAQVERPVAMGLVPVSGGVDVRAFGAALAAELAQHGRIALVDRARMERELTQLGGTPADAVLAARTRALVLDRIEATHDFVLLVGDDTPSDWTARCVRSCDELLLLAHAEADPALHPIERDCLLTRPAGQGATTVLLLVHPADTRTPRGTERWLAGRPGAAHVHLRAGNGADLARLGRLQSRTAVGLVLAGGGARGFAHLGVLRALREAGIEIDCVGGTSIGAVMATYVATGLPPETLAANAQAAFRSNPTSDYNIIPMLSVFKGRKLRQVMQRAVHDLLGFEARVEDLWKNLFMIATNFSRAEEVLIEHGDLQQSLLASIAVPGALPPQLHDGELLCDGGTFNNFPADVMRAMRGVGSVVGVDLSNYNRRRIELERTPDNWDLLRDKLRPRKSRRYHLPSLASYLMNITILYSISRRRESQKLVDLYFNPPLGKVGLLQWSRAAQIEQEGYEHARTVLAAAPAALLERVRRPATPPIGAVVGGAP